MQQLQTIEDVIILEHKTTVPIMSEIIDRVHNMVLNDGQVIIRKLACMNINRLFESVEEKPTNFIKCFVTMGDM